MRVAGPGSLDGRPDAALSQSLRGRQPASLHGAPDRRLGNADMSGTDKSGISAFPGAAPFAFARAPVRLRFTYATQTARPLQARSCGGGGEPGGSARQDPDPEMRARLFLFLKPQMRLPEPSAVHRNPHHTLDIHVTTGRAGPVAWGGKDQRSRTGTRRAPRRAMGICLAVPTYSHCPSGGPASHCRTKPQVSHGFEKRRRHSSAALRDRRRGGSAALRDSGAGAADGAEYACQAQHADRGDRLAGVHERHRNIAAGIGPAQHAHKSEMAESV